MKSTPVTLRNTFTGAIYWGAVLLMAARMSAQNIYVADWYSPGTISEFTPGGGSLGNFTVGDEIEGLAFDSSGNLFVADNSGGTVQEFSASGQSTFASGLSQPNGRAFNSSGDLFEANFGSGNIYEFTARGQTTFASVAGPYGLAFSATGDLYVSSTASNTITEITPGGRKTIFASGLNQPNGLAFDSAGDLFEADEGSGNIYVFINRNGRLSSTPVLFVSGLAEPEGIAINRAGDIYVTVTDNGNGNLDEITPKGISTIATGLGNDVSLAIQGETLPVHSGPGPGFPPFPLWGKIGFQR
jgi:sugar lactone lactonase YvrE